MWWTRTPIPPTDLLSQAVGRRRAKKLRRMIRPPYPSKSYRITRTMELALTDLGQLHSDIRSFRDLVKEFGPLIHGVIHFTHPWNGKLRGVRFMFFLGCPLSWEEALYLACLTPEVLAQRAWKACGTAQIDLTHRPKAG